MPRKQTLRNKRRPAGGQGSRTRLERVLKWVGGITAILSLLFGLHQATQLVSNLRERQRHIAELYKVGKLQQSTADYEGAWASFEQALKTAEAGGQLVKLTGQLGEERRELRQAQEDLAMEWLGDVRVRPSEGQTFSDVVDKLVSILSRGATSASGARKADLLAYIGWANFLRWRDGHLGLNPEQQYRQALEIDPANPYAHAHWGHWKLWSGERLEDTRQHFLTAIASGRARDYVRRMQLAALKNLGEEGYREFLTVVNDMRKTNETIDPQSRINLYSIYAFACSLRFDADLFTKLVAAVPATEQLATFQALFYGAHDADFDEGKRPGRDACLATLLEAAGQREEALRIWLALRQSFPPQAGHRLGDRAQDAIQRLSPRRTLEGERKQVTVLFADLRGSMELLADRDPEEARQLLDPVLERMMDAVHRYEGTVNHVLGAGPSWGRSGPGRGSGGRGGRGQVPPSIFPRRLSEKAAVE